MCSRTLASDLCMSSMYLGQFFTRISFLKSDFGDFVGILQNHSAFRAIQAQISDFQWNPTTKIRKSDKKCRIDVKLHAESESGIRITVAHRTHELSAKDRQGTSSGSGRIPGTWFQPCLNFELAIKF